jgi:hypothetical protein
MKKKLLVPIFLAAMALPLCLAKQPVSNLAEFIGTFTDKSAYLKYGVEINGQMANEGFVLLKNDGTLPLDEGAMISVVGKSSTSLALGGGGSGSASTSSGVTEINNIKKSLENVGFDVNPVTDAFYKSSRSGSGRKNGNDGWKGNSQVVIGESDIEAVKAEDGLLDSLDDLFTIFKHFTWPESEEDKEHIKDYEKAFKSKFAFFVSVLEKKYKDKGKYFLGDYFSLADIFITSVLTNFAEKLECQNIIKEQGPKIEELIERIKKNELKNFFERGYIKESKF